MSDAIKGAWIGAAAVVIAALLGLIFGGSKTDTQQPPGRTGHEVCAYANIKTLGWERGNKTVFCRNSGYPLGNFNQPGSAYSNGGVCLRGIDSEPCKSHVQGVPPSDYDCRPERSETICRKVS